MMHSKAKETNRANPAIAAVLSALIPGAGQIYAGQTRRGLALLFGIPVQAALLYGTQVSGLAFWLGMVWIWNIWDARQLARGAAAPLALPIFILLVLNLLAAWTVTEVRVPELQAEQRSVIRRIMAGLATPDVVGKKSTELTATGKYLIPGPGAPDRLAQKSVPDDQPQVDVFPERVREGETVRVSGRNFAPNQNGNLILLGADESRVGKFRTDSKGRFDAEFKNPRSIPGEYFVQARMRVFTGGWQISETLRTAAPLMLQTVYLALLGTAISLVLALPLSFAGARNLTSGTPLLRVIYALVRGTFTVLRSVEVLIIAVIAVAALGIGPFAGVIALAIHGIGALGKLYSEAIESIEHGPIEALRSTGASELQVVIYAVVPQVVPQFIAFTLYRWDINVRMATVIGLVGGGGIGFQLIQYMNLLQWQQAATAIWLIAGVVMLMDYASAVIREKVI